MMTKRLPAFNESASGAAAQAPALAARPFWLRRFADQIANMARTGLSGTVDFVVPPSCPICRAVVQVDGGLCGACWRQVPWIDAPVCNRLGLPLAYDLGPGAVSAEALASPPEFDRLRAVCTYDGVAPRLVHALKFSNQRHLADSMGAMMARAGQVLLQDADTVLVPVPLHPFRQVHRRYNQAALLARAIGDLTGVPVVHDGVRRVKRTRQQRALSRGDRLRNLRGAFRLTAHGEAALAGKHVVLIDDVHTTGATLNALTHALRAPGHGMRPLQVDALVFATAVVQERTRTI
jgi:ComF family protein